MPMTFGDHMAELLRRFPSAEWHIAEEITWKAILAVYAEHPWSFCVKEGSITTEAAYRTGKVKLTYGSQLVEAVDGAVFDPAWQMRRFIGPGRNEEYDITITGAGTATLAQPWLGETTAAGSYIIFRDVYPVPAGCNYGQEFFILDPKNGRMIRIKDLGVFIRERLRRGFGTTADPEWATRLGHDSNGVPLLRFGPEPPTGVERYPMLFFTEPVKPASPSGLILPQIPKQFEDMVWRRARWLYSEEHGRRLGERNDLRRIYWERHYEAVKVCDGGAEVERVIATQYPAMLGDFASFINMTVED